MKWFQHECDAHGHPDLEAVMNEFGSDGYVGYFGTFEVIGKYGDKFLRLSLEKLPKNGICKRLRLSEDKLDLIWALMAKRKALNPILLKKGVLHAPGLKKRADEYTKKLRSLSGQCRDNIRLHYSTLQDIILHYIKTKGWVIKDKQLLSDIFKRNCSTAKKLYGLVGQDIKKVKEAIDWMAKQGYQWSLETVIKKYPDFLNYCSICKDKGKYTNERGYPQTCDCPKGKAIEVEKPDNPRL